MVDEVLYQLGVDLNSDFNFHDGDIQLASYNDNLVQAVINRLNTKLNSLELFYEDYGSVLTSFFGWKANNTTLNLMRIELDNTLKNETRLSGYSVDMEYQSDGLLHIDLTLYPTRETEINLDLVLNNNGDLEEVVEMEE